MTREQEIEKLKKNSPFELPDNPSQSGWNTKQIKEKFYAGLLVLYEYLEVERGRITTITDEELVAIRNSIASIVNGTTVIGKATQDKDGNNIHTTYAKVLNITNGTIAALKYLKGDGTSENISKIEDDLLDFQRAYNAYIQAYFVEGKAKNSIAADSAIQATKDSLGRIIKDTYATVSSLNLTNAEITKIKDGSTIVMKAYKDQYGNLIDQYYVKKSDLVNNLTDSSTDKGLTAYQGKVLKGHIDSILAILQSPDTDLDTLQEIVAYIKSNKSLIESITISKMGYTDLITNYTSDLNNKPLAASVAVLLKALIDAKLSPSDVVDALNSALTDKPLSAKQGAVLKGLIEALDQSKADKSDTDTKAEVNQKIHNAIAGVSTMNVISDEDNDVEYDFQVKVQGGKLHLILNEIETE